MMNFRIEDKPGNMLALLFVVTGLLLTYSGWAFLGAAHGWGAKKTPFLKSVTYILQ